MSDSAPNAVAINLNLTLADHLTSELFFCKGLFARRFLVGIIGVGVAVGGFITQQVLLLLVSLLPLGIGMLPVYYQLRVCRDWFRGNMPDEMLVTASDSGIVYTVYTVGEHYRATSDWAEVEVHEARDYFFLWSGKFRLPMPKQCFTPEQLSAFVDALNRNKGPSEKT